MKLNKSVRKKLRLEYEFSIIFVIEIYKSFQVKKNKPDNIVFDTETNKYNASVLPYASSVGAPSIKLKTIRVGKKEEWQR